MHQNDFDGFAKLLKRMAATYSKKLDDEVIQGYWTALKDQPLERITAMAEHRMKHSKFFPKPVELRPAEDRLPPSVDGKFEECEARAMRNLEEMREKQPAAWAAHLTESHGDGCRALMYAAQFGAASIWYDIPQRCWRHL